MVRAGQWKLLRVGRRIEIEQAMADDTDDGRTALIRFERGEAVRMDLLATRELSLGPVTIGRAVFEPWKTPQRLDKVWLSGSLPA